MKMKRLLAIITILCLCLTTVVYAEDAPVAAPTGGGNDAFAGTWVETVAHRATIEITAKDSGYTIHVEWPGSASERTVWEIPDAVYDSGKDALVYKDGQMLKRTYKEDGTYEDATIYIEESGTISVKNDTLTWHRDSDDPTVGEVTFNKAKEAVPDYEGIWVDSIAKRASVEITAEGEGYTICVEWPGSVSTREVWEITNAVYDKEKNALVYANGKETERTYKEDGTYEEKLISATATGTFTLTEDGNLTWHRDGSDQEDMTFEKVEIVPPDFTGDWVDSASNRAKMNIKKSGGNYTIHVQWSGSVSSMAVWDITATYDKDKKALVYTNGKESERTYKQDGTYEEKVLSNEASGTLVMKDDGKIYWTRDGADQFPTAFEKYEYTEPDYEGNWVDTVSKRAQMKIKKSGDGYIVRIEWGGGVSTRAMWDIPMVVYNQTKDALVYDNCTEFERNYKSDGTYQDTVFTTKGTGTLTLKSDGKIYWHRNSAPDEDLIFERSSEEFNPFEDVTKEDYFYDAVLWAYKNGITQGMSDTEFMPALNVTRGQVVTFLWRVAGKPAPTKSTNPFADVTKDMYCYEPVLWAVENGITTGMDETHFAPDANVTRAQVVTFLYRYKGKKVETANPFVDVPSGEWYYEAVLWAASNKIVNGMDETHFAPEDNCTRGQIVTILYRSK